MTRPIFDTRMMARLGDFYSQLVTFQQPTETQDANSGAVTMAWANVAGLVALPCALAPSRGDEVKRPDQTFVVSDYTLSLPSNHPEIKEKWRAIVGTVTYDILLVQTDSMAGITRLLVNKVE